MKALIAALDELADTAHQRGEHLYALVDCGKTEDLHPTLQRFAGSQALSLYAGTTDFNLAPVGPWLVPHEVIARGYRELDRIRPLSTTTTWICSPLQAGELITHLQCAREAHIEERTQALLRFYDPQVLPGFLQALPQNLRDALLAPISRWLIIEFGTLCDIHLAPAIKGETQSFKIKLTEPEYFSIQQIGVVKMLHSTLAEELPEQFGEPLDQTQRKRIASHVNRAIELGLRQLNDLSYWVLIAFSITESLHDEPLILAAVETALERNIPLAQATSHITAQQWDDMSKPHHILH